MIRTSINKFYSVIVNIYIVREKENVKSRHGEQLQGKEPDKA
jgi:hypothetical protein